MTMSHKKLPTRSSLMLIGVLLIGLPACQKTEKSSQSITVSANKTAQKFSSFKKEYITLSARYSMESEMLKKYHPMTDEDEKLNKQKASLNTIVMKKNQKPGQYYPSSRVWGDILMATCGNCNYMSSTQVPFATYNTYLNRDKKSCQKAVRKLNKISDISDEIKQLENNYVCLLEDLNECAMILSLDENRVRDNQMRHLSAR